MVPSSPVPGSGADLRGGCRGCAPLPLRDDLQFSNTTRTLQKKTVWFIGVEVEQETSAPPPKKNPGSALEALLQCRRAKQASEQQKTPFV